MTGRKVRRTVVTVFAARVRGIVIITVPLGSPTVVHIVLLVLEGLIDQNLKGKGSKVSTLRPICDQLVNVFIHLVGSRFEGLVVPRDVRIGPNRVHRLRVVARSVTRRVLDLLFVNSGHGRFQFRSALPVDELEKINSLVTSIFHCENLR